MARGDDARRMMRECELTHPHIGFVNAQRDGGEAGEMMDGKNITHLPVASTFYKILGRIGRRRQYGPDGH